MADFIAVVGRGGLVKPISSGIYQVTDALVKDLELGVQGHQGCLWLSNVVPFLSRDRY